MPRSSIHVGRAVQDYTSSLMCLALLFVAPRWLSGGLLATAWVCWPMHVRSQNHHGLSSFQQRESARSLRTIRLNAVNASSATAEVVATTEETVVHHQAVHGDERGMNNGRNSKEVESSSRRPPYWAHPRRKLFRDVASTTPPTPSLSSTSTTTLGDIMSDSEDASLLVTGGSGCASSPSSTLSSSSLAMTYGITHPLDRIALTANGNLQRLVSSYYDAPVSVIIDSCHKRPTNKTDVKLFPKSAATTSSKTKTTTTAAVATPQIWDRVVHLTIYNQTFCTATSEIVVYNAVCQELVESGQVGLGQLFRYLDVLPTFYLHQAGPNKNGGGFWRDYTLQCPELLSCRIHEEFVPGMWELQPLQQEA